MNTFFTYLLGFIAAGTAILNSHQGNDPGGVSNFYDVLHLVGLRLGQEHTDTRYESGKENLVPIPISLVVV